MTFNYLNHEIVILFDSLSVDLLVDGISFKTIMAETSYGTNLLPFQLPQDKHMNLSYTKNYKVARNSANPDNNYQSLLGSQNLSNPVTQTNYQANEVHNFEDNKKSDLVLNEIDELSKQSSNLINKMIAEKAQATIQSQVTTGHNNNYETPEKIGEILSKEGTKEQKTNASNLTTSKNNRERINSYDVSSKFCENEVFQVEGNHYQKSTFYSTLDSGNRKFSDSYPNFEPQDPNLLGSIANASLKPKSKYIPKFNWKQAEHSQYMN